jgi:hypothetical protein
VANKFILGNCRHSLAATDGEELLAMEGDIGGGLILARDILVAKESPDAMNITSQIEARFVGAGLGGFSRLVRLRPHPPTDKAGPPLQVPGEVHCHCIDGKKHVLRGDKGFGDTTILGSDRPNGEHPDNSPSILAFHHAPSAATTCILRLIST